MMAELLGATPSAGHAVFRCSDDGTRWVASGALTFANAGAVLAATRQLPLPSTGVIECDGITAADSAAVALLLSLKRRAAKVGAAITFVDTPAVLTTLAVLYGVEDLLKA